MIDGNKHQVELFTSKLSGKRKITVDGTQINFQKK